MASVREKNGRLYLLGRYPRKDGKPGKQQTMLTLQLDDTPTNRRRAEAIRKEVELAVKEGTFDWADWAVGAGRSNQPTWNQAIDLLYRKKVELGRTSESTWQVNYMGSLKLIDTKQPLTTETIAAALNKYGRNQYTYKKLYYLLKDIATLMSVPFPVVGIPLYGRSTKALDVPDDDEIATFLEKCEAPYRWYFGMMATYGLRPHECEECRFVEDADGNLLVQVDNETKTGFRTVIPLEPEWVDQFELRDKTERPESNRNSDRNDGCSVWMNKYRLNQGASWRPYALRHAYAGRLWREGGSELTIDTAAKLMGHSVKEHLETYRQWIDPNQIAYAAQQAIMRNKAKKVKAAEELLGRQDRAEVDS